MSSPLPLTPIVGRWASGVYPETPGFAVSRIKFTARPVKIFIQGDIFVTELSSVQLPQRLGKLAICIVGGVLSRPPYVVPEFAILSEPPELLHEDVQADKTVSGDFMPSPPRRSRDENACLPPRLDRRARDAQHVGSHCDGNTWQLVLPMFEQNLSGLPDPLAVQLAVRHVVQQGNVRDNLFSPGGLASDRHCATFHLLNKIMPYLFSRGRAQGE
jgi:hypothetical protein